MAQRFGLVIELGFWVGVESGYWVGPRYWVAGWVDLALSCGSAGLWKNGRETPELRLASNIN